MPPKSPSCHLLELPGTCALRCTAPCRFQTACKSAENESCSSSLYYKDSLGNCGRSVHDAGTFGCYSEVQTNGTLVVGDQTLPHVNASSCRLLHQALAIAPCELPVQVPCPCRVGSQLCQATCIALLHACRQAQPERSLTAHHLLVLSRQ